MASIPTKVRIGPIDYQVKTVDYEILDMAGAGHHQRCLIHVTTPPERPAQFIASTLLHEVLHGVYIVYGIEWDEEKITMLEAVFGNLVRDNPDLFIYLIESLAGRAYVPASDGRKLEMRGPVEELLHQDEVEKAYRRGDGLKAGEGCS